MADEDPIARSDSGGRLSISGLRSLPVRYYLGGLFLLGLLLLPGHISTLEMLKMVGAFYFVMFVVSWDFVSGYTGQVSFGHTLFFAVGGYSTALLNLDFGVDPLLGIVAGTVLASLAGLLIAIPALRIEGHYLALFTLLPPLIMLRLFKVFRETFGGIQGLPSPDNLLDMGGFAATADANYYLALFLFVVVFGLTWIITRSDTGTIFTAIKESEDAVSSVGINPNKFKLFAFTTSAAIGGFAGAVFVHTPAGSASPTQLLELVVMIEILLASILGGFGTITGGVVGGFAIYWGFDFFENVDWTVPVIDLVAGVLVVGVGIFAAILAFRQYEGGIDAVWGAIVTTVATFLTWIVVTFLLDLLGLGLVVASIDVVGLATAVLAYLIAFKLRHDLDWLRTLGATVIAWAVSTALVWGLTLVDLVDTFVNYWGLNWLDSVTWAGPTFELAFGQVDELLFFALLLVILMFLSEGIVPWATTAGRDLLGRFGGGNSPAVADGGRPVDGAPPADGTRRRAASDDARDANGNLGGRFR